MTLFRQLLMVIVISFVINLITVLWLQFDSTRSYLKHQLESDLNNTSTSLSMTLRPHLTEFDPVLIESTLNAYFDGGFYEVISLNVFETDEVITKHVPVIVEGVPSWFVDLKLIDAPSVTTTITDGWIQAGELTIKGHPGFAYKQLWDGFYKTAVWILFLTLVLIALSVLAINVVLKPLARIRQKAQDIEERKFGQPIELPATKELRMVTQAINNMTGKLQEQFEEKAALHTKLKEQAFKDDITGFGNRAYFKRQLQAWSNDEPVGAVVFLEILGLSEINHHDGWAKRDEVVVSAANYIRNALATHQNSVACRLSSKEFAFIVTGISKEQTQTLLKMLASNLSNIGFQELFYRNHIFNIGAVQISKPASSSDIFALADHAMHQARTMNDWTFLAEQSDQVKDKLPRTDIKKAIESAVSQSSLGFSRQPVMYIDEGQPLMHYEVFAMLNSTEIGQVNVGTFLSVLDEFNLGTGFDKKVCEMIFAHVQGFSDKCYAINLTTSALKDYDFLMWLIEELKAIPKYIPQLSFEFSEDSVIHNIELISVLCQHFNELGVVFGVDRVGRHFSSLSYLQTLHPSYVKIDHAFTQMALSSNNDAYFVGSLCTTIHNLDIKVIATHVENNEQLRLLKEYNFDGYQGYISKPVQFQTKGQLKNLK